ncbi:amidohydrolase [Myxococcota bacterium]|nr:amidohydrolase [Myxococcota bacterium]
MPKSARGSQIRRELGHPIIDVDGHVLELLPAVHPYLREALGPRLFETFLQQGPGVRRLWQRPSDREMLASRTPQGAWWGSTTNDPLERATVMCPGILYDRMEDLGLDFCVLYTTNALSTGSIEDPELRVGTCRGFNDYYAEAYGPYSDRLAMAGLIPMHTPEEAIAELEHCSALGLKVVTFPEGVLRPIEKPEANAGNPLVWPGQRHWFDHFGFESAYDYDPVWRRTAELGFAVTFHGQMANRPGMYTSANNYSFNHLGLFAAMMLPLCKSLFMGGVSRKFPQQAFAFLECGVSWARQLMLDSIGHWEKRRLASLDRLDPRHLDFDALDALVTGHGGPLSHVPESERRRAYETEAIDCGGPDEPDEWKALEVDSARALCEQFTGGFYFGCEADDRGVATAFSDTNPFGTVLRAMFSSDIGHWDVERIEEVVPEAFELVEDGVLTEEQFRDFTFTHPVAMLRSSNPHFFDGTGLESAVKELA